MNHLRTSKSVIVLTVGLFYLFALLAGGVGEIPAGASSQGPTPGNSGAPGETNCTACHVGNAVNSGGGSVFISGLPRNYRPNQEIPLTVTTEMPGGVVFGFQMTSLGRGNLRSGEFALPTGQPVQVQKATGIIGGLTREYVQHTGDGVIPTEYDKKSWTFTWKAPPVRTGKIDFYVAGNAANSDGTNGGDYIYTSSASVLAGTAPVNFDSDAKSDVAVYRPSQGVWYSLKSSERTFGAFSFGLAGDRLAPGDYDGDGVTDLAVFRPSDGYWYIGRSSAGIYIIPFGMSGDVPVPGDYDGDLKTDVAVWRPSNGVWYVLRSSDGTVDARQWGLAEDKVAQGDYDGDATTDIAVWRPSNGYWYVWRSTDGGTTYRQFGSTGDRPVQGDYDGDGTTDFAVFRPSSGVWFLLASTDGFSALRWGLSTDRPVPGDYDGDGRTDAAVYRDGLWFVYRSSNGAMQVEHFGLAEDIPLPAALIAE
jgi:hypothetical protein